MKMILITNEEPLEREYELINRCFEEGLEDLHLRKYGATEEELLNLLKRIPPQYHSRIVLHHHHYLTLNYELKGVHFNSYSQGVDSFPKGKLIFSRSVHDPKALEQVEASVDRVLLSPIFPPISKTNDRAPIPSEELEAILQGSKFPFEHIALGGVEPEKVAEVKRLGFDGFAVLGGIWNVFRKEGSDAAIRRFEAYRNAMEKCKAIE